MPASKKSIGHKEPVQNYRRSNFANCYVKIPKSNRFKKRFGSGCKPDLAKKPYQGSALDCIKYANSLFR